LLRPTNPVRLPPLCTGREHLVILHCNVFYVIFSSFIMRQCCELYDQSSCEFRGMLLKLRNFQTPSTINL
jgi:hypothetical protein